MADVVAAILLITGAAFTLLAALGLVRMPDLYTRMQSATKAGTLGVAFIATAAAIHFGTASAVIEASLVVVFLFGTAPVASYLIARASHRSGLHVWDRTFRDDLRSAQLSCEPPEGDA